jgi:glucose-1-phosphate thymidylyltransferase
MRKGIVLAGGTGTRLYPSTKIFSKQLLTIYDKPLIFYPLSTLMLSEVRDILIITTPNDHEHFVRLLGDGSNWGINLSYATQEKPKGIAESILIGEKFINNESCSLILGDNIFFGQNFSNRLINAATQHSGATVFSYHVNDPENYGVVKMDKNNIAKEIIEKPKSFISNFAITGLYFYDNNVVEYAKSLRPSDRGELEITDLNNCYLQNGSLNVEFLGRGYAWLDTGTHENMLSASNFVNTVQKRQGLMISCLEEIALMKGWISKEDVERQISLLKNSSYGVYLAKILEAS